MVKTYRAVMARHVLIRNTPVVVERRELEEKHKSFSLLVLYVVNTQVTCPLPN